MLRYFVLLLCLSLSQLSSSLPTAEDQWEEAENTVDVKADCREGQPGGLGAPDLVYTIEADGSCREAPNQYFSITYKVECGADSSATLRYLGPQGTECVDPYAAVTATLGTCFVPFPGDASLTGATLTCLDNGKAALSLWAPPQKQQSFNETSATVTMNDGAPLYADLVFSPGLPFPDTGETKAAAVYVSTPYNIKSAFGAGLKLLPGTIESIVFPMSGSLHLHFDTVLVLQQSRGLYASGPPTTQFAFETGTHAKSDAKDTSDWIQRQEWSNGVIMTQGISAMGMFALMAADPCCPVPTRAAWYSITTNNIRQVFFRQGAMINGIMGSILMPDFLPPSQTDRGPIAAHDSDGPDPFWDNMVFDDWSSINFPTLVRTSWFDMFLTGGLRTADSLYSKSRCGISRWFGCTSTLLVDALGHAGLAGVPDFDGAYPVNATAQNAVVAYEQILSAIMLFVFQKATNDLIMDGLSVFYSGLMHMIPDKIVYVYGKDYLTSFSKWPSITQQDLYLSQSGELVAQPPRGSTQSYTYDPADPAPTLGGWLFNSAPTYGSMDQASLSARGDVIQFNSTPLGQDKAICGAVSATITVASSAVDTDFVVSLVDQHPNHGPRYMIQQGIIRMRWREKLVTPTMMVPGKHYEVEIDMWSACWIIKAGHSVGVDLTSSSSFMYLPNPNTGGPLQGDGIWPQGGEYYTGPNVTATNTIVYGPSKITLPVVNEADLPVMAPLIIPSSLTPPSDDELIEMGKARR